MPSQIRLEKKNKVRGIQRQMLRDAMRQYAKTNHLTMAQVRAEQIVKGPSDKAKKRAERADTRLKALTEEK